MNNDKEVLLDILYKCYNKFNIIYNNYDKYKNIIYLTKYISNLIIAINENDLIDTFVFIENIKKKKFIILCLEHELQNIKPLTEVFQNTINILSDLNNLYNIDILE